VIIFVAVHTVPYLTYGGRLGTSKARTPPHAGALERIGPREVELAAQVPLSQLPRIQGVAEDADAPPDDDAWDVPVPRVSVCTPVKSPASASVLTPASPVITSSAGSAKKFVMPGAVSFYAKVAEKAKPNGPL
jgi:hypothetical protein